MIVSRTAPPTPDEALSAALAGDATDRSGAYLADFAFRHGPAPDTVALSTVPRPAAGEEWTLAQTLQEVRLQRVALVETSHGVRLRHPGRVAPDLARAVARYAGPLRVSLRLAAAHVPAAWRAHGWDDATRLHAAWFGVEFEIPAVPLVLRPGVRVTDAARFRASVAERLAAGPGPAAGSVAEDLAALYASFGAATEHVRVPEPRRALAA